jgi:spermidine/putrescine transport system permease protein
MAAARTMQRRAPWAYVGPALVWTAAFFILPLLVMLWMSLTVHGAHDGLSLSNYAQFLANESYWRALVASVEVTIVVTLVGIGLLAEPVQIANTRFATVTGFVHFFVMLLTLTIFANLKQLSPSYRRAAADLGASALQTFVYVVLPLTLPGIMVGAFLTFVLAIGDYVTPQILGGNNELLMPQLIMMQIGRRGDFPLASALALILMAVVTLAYLACARWLKLERA